MNRDVQLSETSVFVYLRQAPSWDGAAVVADQAKLHRLVAGAIALSPEGGGVFEHGHLPQMETLYRFVTQSVTDLQVSSDGYVYHQTRHGNSWVPGALPWGQVFAENGVTIMGMGYGSPWWTSFNIPSVVTGLLNGLLDVFVRSFGLGAEIRVRRAELEAKQAEWEYKRDEWTRRQVWAAAEVKDLHERGALQMGPNGDLTVVKGDLTGDQLIAVVHRQVDRDAHDLLAGSESRLYSVPPVDVMETLYTLSRSSYELLDALRENPDDVEG